MPRKKKEATTGGVQLVKAEEQQQQPVGYQPLQPNWIQQVLLDLPTTDHCLLGTAKGVGKSVGSVLKILQLAALLKEDFHCLVTRASYQSLQEIQGLLLRHLTMSFPGTKFTASDNVFRIGGSEAPFGRVELAYTAQSPVEQIRAQNRLQGRSFTTHIHDEVGNASSMDFFDTLMGTLRAREGVPTQMIMLANPGGPNHTNLKSRFWIPAGCPEPGEVKRFWSEEYQRNCVFVSATAASNPHIDLAAYSRNVELMAGGDPDMLDALLHSNWGKDIGGAFFASCWGPSRCRFKVSPGDVDIIGAGAFVAMDHGVAAPSVAYLIIPDPPNTPRGTLLLADEFYIASTTLGGQRDFNKGNYVPNAEQARGLLEWLEPWCAPHGHNPGHVSVYMDDACWNANGTHQGSVAGDFKAVGVRIKKAEKMKQKMSSGLAVMRSMMHAAGRDAERPWLMWSPACVGWEATVPTLPRHPRDPELIVDSGAPDHAADACRYGIQIHQRRWATGNVQDMVVY